jgi:hypothetical protein
MKKLFTLLTMLIVGIGSMWATDLTLTPSNGTYVTSSGNYVNSITFSTTPSITVTASANNMDKRQTGTYLLWHSGSSGSSTYTITVDNSTKNYVITGFTVTGEANTSAQTLTVGSESHEFAVGTSSSFTVTGWFPSLSFVQTGANASGLKITSISVTIEEVPDWTPNIDDDACVTVGEKVATFTAATDKNDNEHWYILTQIRDGETPMYDVEAGYTLKRTGTGITTGTINNSYVSQSKKYLVRFIKTGVEGVYTIQFANGNYVTSSLTTNTKWQSSSTYAFYNSNSGTGSYFAWNLYNKNGKRVDNNGAGYNLAFWDAGETSGTSGNNIWYMYETEINPASYTYQISDASGVIYTSDPMVGTVGETITELPASLQRPYCTYNVTSTTIVSGKNTVPVTVTYNPPFTVSSDFASATWYYATLRNKQLRADESKKDNSGRYQTNSTNERTDVYKWAFVGNPYQLSIINKGAGDSKVLYMGSQPVMQAANPANDNKARWIVSANSNGGFTVRSESGATMYINDAGSGGNLGFWNSGWGVNDAGSNWVVTEVPIVDVTYNLKWNSNTIKTVTVSRVTEGEKASDRVPWSVPEYCSFSYDVKTIESTTTEVNVTLNWDGPFEISSDFEHANWCYLKMHGQYLIYSGSSTTPNSLDDLASAESAASKAFWAFVGDPFNGFQLINKAAGSDKNLAVIGWYPNMDTQETKWLLQSWNSDFVLRTSSYLYLNNADGQLKLYVSGQSTEAMNFDCAIESISYKGLALDFIDDYANDHALGQYFGVSTESYNNLRNYYAEAESVSAEDYTLLESNISVNVSPKLPETGYYRIKSSGSRGGESYISYGTLSNGKGTGLVTTRNDKMTDFGTIVKLTRFGTGKKYQISLQGLNVQVHSGDNNLFRATGAEGLNFQFNHINFSGMCSIYDETDHGNMHEASWYNSTTKLNGVVGWTAGDGTNASSWSVEDATDFNITMNGPVDSYYYATLCVPFDVTISDATAYTLAKSESGNYLVPTEVTDNKVPAGTPVLLKGTNATATATINTGSAFGSPLDCALTGIYVTTSVNAKTNYVFGKFNGKVGFYHVDNEEFSLKANRAYLQASVSGARGFSLMFDDDVTGIVSTPGETEEGTTIYNLSGQRLNKIQKGINIVNGKKVLF